MCDSVNISFLRLNDIMDHSLIDKQYTNTLTELLKATDGYFVWLTIIINHLSRGTHALSRVSTFSGWQPRQRSLDLQSHWLTTRSSLPYPSEVRSPPASPYSLNPPESSCCRPLPHAFARLVKQKHGLGGSEIWPRIMLPFQPTGTTRDSAALLLLKANLGNEHFCVLFARAERMWDSSESITAFRQKTAAKLYSQIKRVSTPVCGVRSLDCNAPCFAYSNTRYF